MPDPKPCPVCGGTQFSVGFEETERGVAAFLICDACDEIDETHGPLGQPCGTDADAESEAVLAWNRFIEKHTG